MKNPDWWSGLISVLLVFSSCSQRQERLSDSADSFFCRMNFQVEIDSYDKTTKSEDYIWPDGSTLFIRFNAGSKTEYGTAVYYAADSIWSLYYYGILPEDEELTCELTYLTSYTFTSANTALLPFNCAIYESVEGVYSLSGDEMYVVARLLPKMARIRFYGIPKTSISVSGLTYNSAYNTETSVYTQSSLINCTVQSDSFTPYIYGSFSNPRQPVISIVNLDNDLYEYSREFSPAIMNPGKSGWLTIPSETSNKGWIRVERSEYVIRVETDSVYDIGTTQAKASGTITTLGSEVDLVQCGHVWSTEPQPTIESINKTELGRSSSAISFVSPLLNLDFGTKYYVRAYARTDNRVQYGEEISFTTVSIYAPSLSSVSVTAITDSSAHFHASVTSAGNGTVYSSGFCYSADMNPTLYDNVVSCDKMTLDTTIVGLKTKTVYYVRAYAINEKGTNYGEQTSFKTAGSKPSEDGNPPAGY